MSADAAPSQRDVSSQFARELKQLRVRAGWTQEDLSERTGLSLATIGALEHGRRSPHASTVVKLADALRLNPAQRTTLFELAGSGATSLKTRARRLKLSAHANRAGLRRQLG
jgi:transcriptional regulator with XRE-family HTH domain